MKSQYICICIRERVPKYHNIETSINSIENTIEIKNIPPSESKVKFWKISNIFNTIDHHYAMVNGVLDVEIVLISIDLFTRAGFN